MDKEQLLEQYVSGLPNSPYRGHYISYAKRFLDHARGLDRAGRECHRGQ